jgi:predicted XRE-type DNA-binding protein
MSSHKEEGKMRLNIKLEIIKSGKPQWQIAQAVGVSEHALSKFVRGHGKLRPKDEQKLIKLLELEEEVRQEGQPSR